MNAFIQDVPTRDQYTAAAAQTIFDYTFPIFDKVDLIVEKTQLSDGVTSVLVLTTDYTVNGVGAQAGGTIVLTSGATVGDIYTITRQVEKKRITDYSQQAAFNSKNVNLEFNRIVQMTQDRARDIEQSLRFPDADVNSPANDIPDEVARRGNVLAFDENTSQPIAGVSNSALALLVMKGLSQLTADPSAIVTSFSFARLIDSSTIVGGEIVRITDAVRGGDFVVTAGAAADNDVTILEFTDDPFPANSFHMKRLNTAMAVYLGWFGAVGDGVTDDTVALQAAIDYANSTGDELLDGGGDYVYTTLEWKSGVYLTGVSDVSSRLVLSGAISPSIFSSAPITNFGIRNFGLDGDFLIETIPGLGNAVFGVDVPCEALNSYFHTWRRTDARGQTVFNALAPTFGDAATYDGTGGLKDYHADAWYVKMFGNQGTGVMTQVLNDGEERKITRSDYHLNYVTISVQPPANDFNLTNTNATTHNAVTMTLTVGTHSRSVNDFIWWDGADYDDGGSGVIIEDTFQITAITATTVTFVIIADTNFVSWNNFGRITDDPDNTGFLHIHDPVLGTIRKSWIRDGTSSQETTCRIPMSRLGGFVMVRVKMRHNSGDGDWLVRIFQNFGNGGDANVSTTLPGFTLDTASSDIQEFLIYAELPTLTGKTFGDGSFVQIGITTGVHTSDIDIYEIALFEGLNLPATSDSSYAKEKPIFQKLYDVHRAGWLTPVEAGRFYNINMDFSEQFYGVPVITEVAETITSNVDFSSIGRESVHGYRVTIVATATNSVGEYAGVYEAEYQIPASFVGA